MLQITTGQKIGPFEIRGFLGRGAFAQVFSAIDSNNRRVALKLGDESGGGRFLRRFREITSERSPTGLSPDETPAEAMFLDPSQGARAEILDSSEVDQLLWREAKLLESAGGNGFPEFYGVEEVEDRPVIVMEEIDGGSLRDRIRSLEGVKLSWFIQVAETLETVQELGWECHGDIKPENILVRRDESIVLIDPTPSLDRTDLCITTPWYNPFLERSQKSDAQSIATILYELFCGALPFEQVPFRYAGCAIAKDQQEDYDLMMSLFLSFPRPRELNPRSPVEFDRMIYHAMADPSYGLVELRQDMQEFLLKNQ